MRELGETLRSHELQELLDRWTTADHIADLARQVDALDTWWRFARGDTINLDRLADTVDTLSNVDDPHGRWGWLIDTVDQFWLDTGVHLPTVASAVPDIEAPSLDIGAVTR